MRSYSVKMLLFIFYTLTPIPRTGRQRPQISTQYDRERTSLTSLASDDIYMRARRFGVFKIWPFFNTPPIWSARDVLGCPWENHRSIAFSTLVMTSSFECLMKKIVDGQILKRRFKPGWELAFSVCERALQSLNQASLRLRRHKEIPVNHYIRVTHLTVGLEGNRIDGTSRRAVRAASGPVGSSRLGSPIFVLNLALHYTVLPLL
ncbi:hypothetical protein EVAR_99310_1 [Eumeta japonica]|uniref:Uncharacterized protein n=1 Tax=Eumeta variegata TaxID=151549 RepID=A0A4C1YZF7_EUMVA|nr:hypothetical protein EVAR_99310_1 [Eumeta japonica]